MRKLNKLAEKRNHVIDSIKDSITTMEAALKHDYRIYTNNSEIAHKLRLFTRLGGIIRFIEVFVGFLFNKQRTIELSLKMSSDGKNESSKQITELIEQWQSIRNELLHNSVMLQGNHSSLLADTVFQHISTFFSQASGKQRSIEQLCEAHYIKLQPPRLLTRALNPNLNDRISYIIRLFNDLADIYNELTSHNVDLIKLLDNTEVYFPLVCIAALLGEQLKNIKTSGQSWLKNDPQVNTVYHQIKQVFRHRALGISALIKLRNNFAHEHHLQRPEELDSFIPVAYRPLGTDQLIELLKTAAEIKLVPLEHFPSNQTENAFRSK